MSKAKTPKYPCPVAKRVADNVIQRSRVGYKKYGVNLMRQDLTFLNWLGHLQDELLDAAVYIERLKVDESKRNKKTYKSAEVLPGMNRHQPVIHVKHSELKRSDSSIYRSICPKCMIGTLLVTRDSKTLDLLPNDTCILCGQHFIYDDVPKIGLVPKNQTWSRDRTKSDT